MATPPGQETKPPGSRGQLLLAVGLAVLFALVVYVPYVAGGGYVGDDWNIVRVVTLHPHFWDAVKSWFPSQSFRPLAPFVFVGVPKLLGDRPPLLILTNLLCWFAAIGVLCRGLQRDYGFLFAITLSLLATVPVLSSGVLFWPVVMICATLSLLMWALSLRLLIRSLERGRYSILPYALLLVSMFLLEVALPLFVLTALFPFLWMSARRVPIRPRLLRHVTKYVVPPVAVVLLAAVLQKVVLLSFTSAQSRFQPSVFGMVKGAGSWVFAVGPGQVLLWAHGLGQGLHDWTVALTCLAASGVGVAAFAVACRAEAAAPRRPMPGPERKRILWVLLLCLASCSGLFALSGMAALFSGTPANRILSSTWVALAMVLAFLAGQWASRLLRLAVCVILVLSTCAFLVERDNSVRSWRVQKTVAKVFAEAMNGSDMRPGAVVMGDVPRVVGGRYLYAEAFRFPWDWGSVVALAGDRRAVSGGVVGRNPPRGLEVTRCGDELVMGDSWKAPLRDVWLFRFDPQTQRGSLRKINGADDWDRTVLEVERRNLNPRPDTIEDTIRKWISHDMAGSGS